MNEADTPPGAYSFAAIQTQTGWGQTLRGLAEWCQPQPGWLTLDAGCGTGLLPGLLAGYGCQATGADLDFTMFAPPRLHTRLVQADVLRLPFPGGAFHLVTSSNLLFLLPDPLAALNEMARVLHAAGSLVTLNPSEHMSVAAASALADQHGLTGVGRASLLNWASRAEANFRWTEAEMQRLFASAGLRLVDTTLRVGPGLARFARAVKA